MAVQRIMLALCLAAGISSSFACTATGVEVTKASAAAKPSDSSAYGLGEVREHFDQMKPITYVSNTKQTYTCVDARGDDQHLSTPG
jgi:hypothetical protein